MIRVAQQLRRALEPPREEVLVRCLAEDAAEFAAEVGGGEVRGRGEGRDVERVAVACVDQVLGSLLAYDQRHQAHLVLTLSTYLTHNGNLQATARELSLHVNSVAYRLQRVQAIARLNLELAEDRLLAQVALKILDGLDD